MEFLYKNKNKMARLIVENALITCSDNVMAGNTGNGFEDIISRNIIFTTIKKKRHKQTANREQNTNLEEAGRRGRPRSRGGGSHTREEG